MPRTKSYDNLNSYLEDTKYKNLKCLCGRTVRVVNTTTEVKCSICICRSRSILNPVEVKKDD